MLHLLWAYVNQNQNLSCIMFWLCWLPFSVTQFSHRIAAFMHEASKLREGKVWYRLSWGGRSSNRSATFMALTKLKKKCFYYKKFTEFIEMVRVSMNSLKLSDASGWRSINSFHLFFTGLGYSGILEIYGNVVRTPTHAHLPMSCPN